MIEDASKIWADAVYVENEKVETEKTETFKVDLGHILDGVEKTGAVPQEYIDEAREMNARVDEYFAQKESQNSMDEEVKEEIFEEQSIQEETISEPEFDEEAEKDKLLAKYTETIITGKGGMSKDEFRAHHRVEYAKDLIREHKDSFTYDQAKDFIEKVRSPDISRAVIDYQFGQVLKNLTMEKEDDGMDM